MNFFLWLVFIFIANGYTTNIYMIPFYMNWNISTEKRVLKVNLVLNKNFLN